MTTMGGRPVQTADRRRGTAKREPVRPPAAKTPEMTVPLPNAKPVKVAPAPTVKQAPDEARGRTPTRGAQTSCRQHGCRYRHPWPGLRAVDRRRRRFRLVARRRRLLLPRIHRDHGHAHPLRRGARTRARPGRRLVKFTIQRDGSLTNVELERSSGTHAARPRGAARRARPRGRCRRCPRPFPNPTLTVHLNFEYK